MTNENKVTVAALCLEFFLYMMMVHYCCHLINSLQQQIKGVTFNNTVKNPLTTPHGCIS